MTRADFQRVRTLFLAARKLSGPAREIYLSEACGDDAALKAEVDSLLAGERAAAVIDTPVLGSRSSAAILSAVGAVLEAPERVGGYRIIRPIGEGAMGTVYEAEQENPRRRVALKVLRSGMVSTRMMERFAREAQILGRLHHPGIAQVYEAGSFASSAGREQPFFAMEFIEGPGLARYNAERGLDTRARLHLVAKICDAVQHAHERGVVHRDLKPANIMVMEAGTGEEGGQPKVLDFGVARVVDADQRMTTIQTGMGQLIGTVAYMSPEQARGAEADARSDVYSLGVILYELLAGRLPYEIGGQGLAEAVRVIQEVEAAPLSTIQRVFRGDLETVVARALEKERERRYQTAGELGSDIRRFLADQPIVARPATRMYQLSKFARRNRVLVGGVLGTVAALVVGLAVSTTMYLRAEGARVREGFAKEDAQRQARKATAVKDFILQRMLRSPDPGQAGRQVTMAEVLDQAAREASSAFAGDPVTEAEVRVALAHTYLALGAFEAGRVQAQAAVELREKTLGRTHAETLSALATLGQAYVVLDQAVEGELVLKDARARLAGDERSAVALDVLGSLGDALQKNGKLTEAETLLKQVIATRESLSDKPDDGLLYNVNVLGACLTAANRSREAVGLHKRFYEMARSMHGAEHPSTIGAMINLGRMLVELTDFREAEPLLAEATGLAERVLGPTHLKTGLAHMNYASCLAGLGKEGAEPHFERGTAVVRAALGDGAYTSEHAVFLHYDFLMRQGKLKESEAVIAQRIAMRRASGKAGDEAHIGVLMTHITVLNRMAGCKQAEIEGREAIELAQKHYPAGDARVALVESYYGETLICLKRYEEAELILRRCYEAQKGATGKPVEDAVMTAVMLEQLYDRMGKGEEARRWGAVVEQAGIKR